MVAETILDIVSLAWKWVPIRAVVIDVTQQGVRFWLGKPTALLGRGIHWYIPWVGGIYVDEVIPQVIETETQAITTSDAKPLGFSISIHYRVVDLRQQFVGVDNFEASLFNLAQTIAASCLATSSFDAIQDNKEAFAERIREELQAVVTGWGVQIERLGFPNLTTMRTFRAFVD